MAANPDRASYFPAIEKRYGMPMSYWFEQMETIKDRKYAEQVAWLRENHGFSQAHANALVLYSRGSTNAHRYSSFDDYFAQLDAEKRATMERIFDAITDAYPDMERVIAWNQPMLKRDGRYVFGASAQAHHILIAPFQSEVINDFRPRLTDYVVNKKTIRVPSDWDVDEDLLRDLIAACEDASTRAHGPR